MMMPRFVTTLALLCAVPTIAIAQGEGVIGAGFEAQLYPSGGIFSVRGSIRTGDRDAFFGFLGFNVAERGNNGVHGSETGEGPGVGIAWRHFLGEDHGGWYFGVRTDVYALKIDWQDPGAFGTTDIVVLQPTAQGGYTFDAGDGWVIDVGASLGAEINVSTTGEPVGDGAILLLGLGTEYRF
jgi:hypothetical protein